MTNVGRGLHRLFLVLAGCWILLSILLGESLVGLVSAAILYAATFGVAWIARGFRGDAAQENHGSHPHQPRRGLSPGARRIIGATLFWLGLFGVIGANAMLKNLPPAEDEATRWGRIAGSLTNMAMTVGGGGMWWRNRKKYCPDERARARNHHSQ